MSQYGDRKGEDWRDLSHEPQGTPAECAGCHKTVEADDLDEDGLCPGCEAEDDELEEMGEVDDGLDSEGGPDRFDDADHRRDLAKDGEPPAMRNFDARKFEVLR